MILEIFLIVYGILGVFFAIVLAVLASSSDRLFTFGDLLALLFLSVLWLPVGLWIIFAASMDGVRAKIRSRWYL